MVLRCSGLRERIARDAADALAAALCHCHRQSFQSRIVLRCAAVRLRARRDRAKACSLWQTRRISPANPDANRDCSTSAEPWKTKFRAKSSSMSADLAIRCCFPLTSFIDAGNRRACQALHPHSRTGRRLAVVWFSGTGGKTTFHALNNVAGIGPKLAVNILSGIPADELAQRPGTGISAGWFRFPGWEGSSPSACWWNCATN